MARKNEGDIKSKCKRLLVAAIDFGTTYSGYAFSWKSEWRKINLQTCITDKFVSPKASTTLLLYPDQTFYAFGNGAENTFKDLAAIHKSDSDTDTDSEEETDTSTSKPSKNWKDYYYFHRFKMLLHKDETLHRDLEIMDISGKPMKAMEVFSICIKHLKDGLLEEINKKLTSDIMITDIDFVITVPAIWGDAAKMFMREAAVKAGIETEQLTLALEPEAASIYCQFCHPPNQDHDASFDAFRNLVKEKRKYMVVDLGGGTGDITVHKQAEDEFLEEVIPATGGPIGGTTVDRAFETFLETIGGKNILKDFKKSHMEDNLFMFSEFEAKKRDGGAMKVRVTVPLELERMIKRRCNNKTIAKILEDSEYKEGVTYKQKKLIFEPSVFKSFFREAEEGVIKCVEDILKNDSCADLSDIIMVGGFSESKLIQNSLRDKFRSQNITFLIPDEPGLAVLKGAVYFGHLPNAISRRVSRYTYGVQICRKFVPGKDPESRKITLGGVDRCMGVLHPIIRRGDRIEAGLERPHAFQTLQHKGGKFNCGFYVSDKRDTQFVDDKDCRLLGTLTVDIPNTKREHPPEIEETFIFGETELTFRAKLLGSGLPIECSFDMLDNSKLPQKKPDK